MPFEIDDAVDLNKTNNKNFRNLCMKLNMK